MQQIEILNVPCTPSWKITHLEDIFSYKKLLLALLVNALIKET